MSFTVVTEHPDLLKYAVSLQAKNSNELGFLPQVVFERVAECRRLFLGLLNGQPCGYILVGSGWQGVLRRWQVCIQYDARRRLYGAMLVAAAEQYGESVGCTSSLVRCASELEANQFWQCIGYRLIGQDESGAARKSRRAHINIWNKDLSPAWVATTWKNGRPRLYASNAERQRAYRHRRSFGVVS